MGKYAQNTSVAVSKSKAEIEKTLTRYGAKEFAYGCGADMAMIGFVFEKRTIRITIILPPKEDFRYTAAQQERNESTIEKHWEQACRQRWRALALVIKAKLEAIESGIASLEDEFLAYTVLPGGSTVGQQLGGEINTIIETGKMSQLLLTGDK
ncbi:hypothetical protein LCGC14_0743340 [marine sediment metagenome]|uniref:Uncharacterized protein n=1 Tax=marine sediment metagenome TaxID=412755 RepID=A0A0F9TD79_9ZZZZ